MFGVTRKLSSLATFGSKISSPRPSLVPPAMLMDTGRMVFSTGLVDTVSTKQPNSSRFLKMDQKIGRFMGIPSRAFRISTVLEEESQSSIAHVDYISPQMVDAMIKITKQNPFFGIHALKACQNMEIRPVLPSPIDQNKIQEHFNGATKINLVDERIIKAAEIWEILRQTEENLVVERTEKANENWNKELRQDGKSGRFELTIEHYNAHLQIRLSDENFDFTPKMVLDELKEINSNLKRSKRQKFGWQDNPLNPNMETIDLLIEKCRQEGNSYGSAVLLYIKIHWNEKHHWGDYGYLFPLHPVARREGLQLILADGLNQHKKNHKLELKTDSHILYIVHVTHDFFKLVEFYAWCLAAMVNIWVVWPGVPFFGIFRKAEFVSLIASEYMNRKDKGAQLALLAKLFFSIYLLAVLYHVRPAVQKDIEQKKSWIDIFCDVIIFHPILVLKWAYDDFDGLKKHIGKLIENSKEAKMTEEETNQFN